MVLMAARRSPLLVAVLTVTVLVASAAYGAKPGHMEPLFSTTAPMAEDPVELLLNRTWRPTLSVVGFDGAPATGVAGNVLRPNTGVRLSFRLPPLVDSAQAASAVIRMLCENPPSGATVQVHDVESAEG